MVEISMKTYWHSIGDDMFARVMMHNTRLREGFLLTGAALAALLPEGSIISPYSSFTNERPKEDMWEDLRFKNFPHLPSRKNALFLFEDELSLQIAEKKWWPGQSRKNLSAQVVDGSSIHKADSNWLDCTEEAWERNANAYWSGLTTPEPIFEVVVQGQIYFPDWQEFPLNPFE